MGNGSAEADPAQIHYKPGMVQDRYERNFSMGFSRGQKVNWADSHVCMELAFSFSELMSRLQAVVGKVSLGRGRMGRLTRCVWIQAFCCPC